MKPTKLLVLLAMAAVLTGNCAHGAEKNKSSGPPDFTKENPLDDKDVQEHRNVSEESKSGW